MNTTIDTDTPPESLLAARVADLETMVGLLEERLASEQTERRRLERLYEECSAECARLRQMIAVAESESD